MEKSNRHSEREKKVLKEKIVGLEEMHKADKLRLKDELKRIQDSHHEYLAKLMDVLDTTHAAREEETARISEELNAVKEEKDTLIKKLLREVKTLRKSRKSHVPAMGKREMASSRKEIENNLLAREERNQKFFVVALSLETMLGQCGATSDMRRKSSGPSEEDVMRMKQMVRFLGDVYSMEEQSQARWIVICLPSWTNTCSLFCNQGRIQSLQN
jgi:NADH dehydrogenase/NADH:ubiquinone oxidoreductase subunit G